MALIAFFTFFLAKTGTSSSAPQSTRSCFTWKKRCLLLPSLWSEFHLGVHFAFCLLKPLGFAVEQLLILDQPVVLLLLHPRRLHLPHHPLWGNIQQKIKKRRDNQTWRSSALCFCLSIKSIRSWVNLSLLSFIISVSNSTCNWTFGRKWNWDWFNDILKVSVRLMNKRRWKQR